MENDVGCLGMIHSLNRGGVFIHATVNLLSSDNWFESQKFTS